MEGLGILVLFWILSAVFERIRRKGGQADRPTSTDSPARWRGQADRPPAPARTADEQWRKELEQLFGMPGERGPLGRQSPVELPSAEDVEEPAPPEEEPEVVSFDAVASERAAPQRAGQDEGAEALVRRRIEAAEARSHGLTRADHERFDRMVRTEPPIAVADHTAARRPRGSLRDALIWKEILGPPLGLRRPE
jgi:hypothetical protein